MNDCWDWYKVRRYRIYIWLSKSVMSCSSVRIQIRWELVSSIQSEDTHVINFRCTILYNWKHPLCYLKCPRDVVLDFWRDFSLVPHNWLNKVMNDCWDRYKATQYSTCIWWLKSLMSCSSLRIQFLWELVSSIQTEDTPVISFGFTILYNWEHPLCYLIFPQHIVLDYRRDSDSVQDRVLN